MAKREGIRRGSRRSFAGLLITIALHGVIALAVKAAHSTPQGPIIVQRDFVQAEMVKLGKPREKFWLPRITQPPPPPPPDALKIADDPNAKAAPVEAPKLEDPKTSKDVKRALERAAKLGALAVPEEPLEGEATGSKLGTSNRQVGDPYDSAVIETVRQNYNLPAGMSPDQIPDPPEVQFRVTADGTITKVKLNKPSGNPLVDDACVSAAQQTRKVDAPPAGKPRAYLVACQK